MRVSLWSGLWMFLFPGAALHKAALAAADEYHSPKTAKTKKTKLKDAVQFEVTTSQFDVHTEHRSPWPLVMTAIFLLGFVGYTVVSRDAGQNLRRAVQIYAGSANCRPSSRAASSRWTRSRAIVCR